MQENPDPISAEEERLLMYLPGWGSFLEARAAMRALEVARRARREKEELEKTHDRLTEEKEAGSYVTKELLGEIHDDILAAMEEERAQIRLAWKMLAAAFIPGVHPDLLNKTQEVKDQIDSIHHAAQKAGAWPTELANEILTTVQKWQEAISDECAVASSTCLDISNEMAQTASDSMSSAASAIQAHFSQIQTKLEDELNSWLIPLATSLSLAGIHGIHMNNHGLVSSYEVISVTAPKIENQSSSDDEQSD